jgi:large subunit ribosomal protein L27
VLRFWRTSCYCREHHHKTRGSKHNPGVNYISKDHTLHARGYVVHSKERDNKSYVSIIPFEVEA